MLGSWFLGFAACGLVATAMAGCAADDTEGGTSRGTTGKTTGGSGSGTATASNNGSGSGITSGGNNGTSGTATAGNNGTSGTATAGNNGTSGTATAGNNGTSGTATAGNNGTSGTATASATTGFTTGTATNGATNGFTTGTATNGATNGFTTGTTTGATGTGTTATATGATTAGTTGSVAVDSTFAMNGFGMNTSWKGYVYASTFGTTATISPDCTPAGAACFSASAAKLCVSGTVGADTTYNSGALLGWNVNQAMSTSSTSPPVMTAATTGTGLTIQIAGSTTNMRVQLNNGTMSWCALAPASGMGTIPWTMFNTKCWDGTGTAYVAGTPITAVQLVIPADGTMARPFSFCLVSASEG
jgi:hypothetical protein